MDDREKRQSVNYIQFTQDQMQGNEYPAFIKAAKILTVSVTRKEDRVLWS
jgi:hypothetical protein